MGKDTIHCPKRRKNIPVEDCLDGYTDAMEARGGQCFACVDGAALKIAMLGREKQAEQAQEPKDQGKAPRARDREPKSSQAASTGQGDGFARHVAKALEALWPSAGGDVVTLKALRDQFEVLTGEKVHHLRFGKLLGPLNLTKENRQLGREYARCLVLDEFCMRFMDRELGSGWLAEQAPPEPEPEPLPEAAEFEPEDGETSGDGAGQGDCVGGFEDVSGSTPLGADGTQGQDGPHPEARFDDGCHVPPEEQKFGSVCPACGGEGYSREEACPVCGAREVKFRPPADTLSECVADAEGEAAALHFEPYDPASEHGRGQVEVSLVGSGHRLGIRAGAVRLFGLEKYRGAALGFDRERRVLRLEFKRSSKAKRALKLGRVKGNMVLSAQGLVKAKGIHERGAWPLVPVDGQDGVFLVFLGEGESREAA